MILTEREAQKQLQSSNRDYYGRKTWEQHSGNIDVTKQQAESGLTYDYAKELGQAYSSAMQSEQAILGDKYSTLNKPQAIQSIDQALQEAYNAYLQNYQKGLANIEELASEATSQITKNLETEAANTKLMQESAYKYLQYLYQNYSDSPMFQEELWKRYLTTEDDITRLKTWEELSPELYDAEGNLNIKGADFYDQMMNQISQGTYGDTSKSGQITDYYSWLRSENPDLYDWAKSYNPYDYSMYYDPITGEFVNSKEGSFKTMVGLTSADEKYTFMERFGGLSKSEVDKMYSGFTSKLTELNSKVNKSSGRDTKEITNEFTDLTAQIGDLTDQLGITADIENELGMSLDDLGKYLANNASNAVSNGDIWYQGILNTLEMAGSGALIGKSMGATYGAIAGTVALPVLGTVTGAGAGAAAGTILGAISGLIVGVASSINQSEQTKEQNRALAKASRDAYDNLVTTLITYSQNKQRQAQIDYYKK